MHISSADKKEKPWFLKALKTRRNPFFDKTVRKTGFIHMCFHYTIDEHGVSSLRKGRKCERNPSGVSFAFNSRPQATVCAADRFRTNKKRHAEACLFLLCFHYTIDEHTSCRSDSDQPQNQARFCKNVFSAIWITKSRSSGSAFAKSI